MNTGSIDGAIPSTMQSENYSVQDGTSTWRAVTGTADNYSNVPPSANSSGTENETSTEESGNANTESDGNGSGSTGGTRGHGAADAQDETEPIHAAPVDQEETFDFSPKIGTPVFRFPRTTAPNVSLPTLAPRHESPAVPVISAPAIRPPAGRAGNPQSVPATRNPQLVTVSQFAAAMEWLQTFGVETAHAASSVCGDREGKILCATVAEAGIAGRLAFIGRATALYEILPAFSAAAGSGTAAEGSVFSLTGVLALRRRRKKSV